MAAPVNSPEPELLSLTGVTKSFGGVHALRGVDFHLLRGEVHALVGENGAGKSTLMKILAGNHRADAGTLTLDGRERHFDAPRDAQRAGVAIVHQELSLVPDLTIAENIFAGREPTRFLGFVDRAKLHAGARDALKRLGLDLPTEALVRHIDVAMRQMVEIAKAISLDCSVLILDEPTSALTDRETALLFDVVRRLRERGVGIVYISHKLGEVFEIADRITVLRDGQLVGTVGTTEVTPDDVVRMMVGRELDHLFPEKSAAIGETVLEVEGLTREPAFRDVSLRLRAGEITGLAGLVGAGRTEVARAIFGVDRADSGRVLLEGKPLRIRSPEEAIAHGIAYLPEDRKEQGLFLEMAVRANIVAASLREHSRHGFLVPAEQTRTAERMCDRMRIKTSSIEAPVDSLSGGNQQKVLFGKWLAHDLKVFLVDEPTRGIDVGAKSEVHALLRDLAASGVAVLVISSELPEVIGASDRVLVMHEGRLVGEVAGDEMTEENTMMLAAGRAREGESVVGPE
jgi:ABC-type sugar transport system ATPase subunit